MVFIIVELLSGLLVVFVVFVVGFPLGIRGFGRPPLVFPLTSLLPFMVGFGVIFSFGAVLLGIFGSRSRKGIY